MHGNPRAVPRGKTSLGGQNRPLPGYSIMFRLEITDQNCENLPSPQKRTVPSVRAVLSFLWSVTVRPSGNRSRLPRAVHTVAAAAGTAFGAVGILIDTVERIEKAHTYYRQKNDILHDLMPP